MTKVRSYHEDWDEYVENWKVYAGREAGGEGNRTLAFPGDEWGTPASWDRVAETFLLPYLPREGKGIAVEIGQGSGKYTLRVLGALARIICFDVSRRFLEVARSRLDTGADAGKVSFEFLELSRCYEIRDCLERHGVLGKVDLFFSMDSMVHVELHTLFAYFLNAALALRPGGHLVMSVADCTSQKGFTRLVREVPWCYGGRRPSHQFFFLSPEIVRVCLERLGFETVGFEVDRDILFVARRGQDAEGKAGEVVSLLGDLVEKTDAYVEERQAEDLARQDRVARLEGREGEPETECDALAGRLATAETERERLFHEQEVLGTFRGLIRHAGGLVRRRLRRG